MTARVLQRLGEWEWHTEPNEIILPASHAGEKCVRVRYRRVGDRVFRSFSLLGYDGDTPTEEAVIIAIAEHASNGR